MNLGFYNNLLGVGSMVKAIREERSGGVSDPG